MKERKAKNSDNS